MGKGLKIILFSLLGLFVAIQFIPASRPAHNPLVNYDFFVANNVSPEVESIIRNACYDCHSQEVRYPWYAYVAPVSWQVSKDVRHGRANLDFSNWDQLSKREKLDVLDEIGDEVDGGSMPLPIYPLMHSQAKLTTEQREQLVKWAEDLAEKVFEE
jgi:uncharacterized membrane protein